MASLIEELNVDDGGAGERLPVVIVPAAAGTTSQWRAQLEHLRRSRRALALELRGHGASRARARRDTTVEQYAEDVAAVVDALGLKRFVLAGHSFGGAVASSYAATRPDRVAGLLLIDPASDGRQIPKPMADGLLEALGTDAWYSVVESYWEPMLAPSERGVREQVLGDLRRTAHETVYSSLASLLQFDPVSALNRYRGPKRAIVTQFNEDPSAYHRLVSDLPHDRVEGVGHWLQLDVPERVSAAFDAFLAGIERG